MTPTNMNAPAKPLPDLSVILVAPGRYEAIRKTVRALGTQTVSNSVEIVIVAASRHTLELVEREFAPFHSLRVIELGKIQSVAAALAAGVRGASAAVVAICEDHAYPEPGWAEALIETHRQPWAAVGPAFLNANPGLLSWVALVMGYGRWVEPVTGGITDDVPGHNSAWKRSLLLNYGSRLELMLSAPTFMNGDLRAQGHQLYLEPAAKVRHLQITRLRSFAIEHFYVARLFPAMHARNWPWHRRLFYVCAMPVLLARTLRAWLGHLRRIDRAREILPHAGPMLLLALAIWGMGEVVGYAFGAGNAQQHTIDYETNRTQHLSRRDRELHGAH